MKKCPVCRGRFGEELQVCANCALCYRCAHKRGLPTQGAANQPLPPSCSCGHFVVPYGSKEYRHRFRAANPTASLVGRLNEHILLAKFPGIGVCKLVGGTPEHPSMIALR
jgi:hypothetical protein